LFDVYLYFSLSRFTTTSAVRPGLCLHSKKTC
jgi:hypothetical protein